MQKTRRLRDYRARNESPVLTLVKKGGGECVDVVVGFSARARRLLAPFFPISAGRFGPRPAAPLEILTLGALAWG